MEGQEMFLPPPLPGETLYSLCARAATMSRKSPAQASACLLGHSRGSRQIDLLSGLGHLTRLYLQSGQRFQTDETALRLRSALGGSMAFLAPQVRRNLVDLLQQSPGLGKFRGRISVDRGRESIGLVLRRCPDCLQQDLQQFGFTYWRTAHQFPGVWLCPWHARPLQWLPPLPGKLPTWEVAQQPADRFQEFSVCARCLEPLLLTVQAIMWCGNQAQLSTSSLAILVRARLRELGLTRREGKLDHADCQRVHDRVSAVLTAARVPHFPRPSAPDWVLRMLNGRGYNSPLGWAVLLASTMPTGFCLKLVESCKWPQPESIQVAGTATLGFCEPCDLDTDLAQARERVPQLTLFREVSSTRISLAPERLYVTLGLGLKLAEAARRANMSVAECRRWIRRDPRLQAYWHDRVASLRTDQAVDAIQQYTSAYPGAMRSQVIRTQNRAIRSLERYAPGLLNELLPDVQPKYSRQRMLFPGVSDGQPGLGQSAHANRSNPGR